MGSEDGSADNVFRDFCEKINWTWSEGDDSMSVIWLIAWKYKNLHEN